jgi:hypothetical protein
MYVTMTMDDESFQNVMFRMITFINTIRNSLCVFVFIKMVAVLNFQDLLAKKKQSSN